MNSHALDAEDHRVIRDGAHVTACDFCGAETTGQFCEPDGLYLEEGDLYYCKTCGDRWDAAEQSEWDAVTKRAP